MRYRNPKGGEGFQNKTDKDKIPFTLWWELFFLCVLDFSSPQFFFLAHLDFFPPQLTAPG